MEIQAVELFAILSQRVGVGIFIVIANDWYEKIEEWE